MKTTKEIRERVKELLTTSKVISVKVRTKKLDYMVHNSVYVLTTNLTGYQMTEYYYQNGKLVSISGDVFIHDVERMKELFKN